jgi:hypothetical protein
MVCHNYRRAAIALARAMIQRNWARAFFIFAPAMLKIDRRCGISTRLGCVPPAVVR